MMAGNQGRTGISAVVARFLARQMEAAGAEAPVTREAVLAVRRQLEGFVRDGFLVAEEALFVRVAGPARPSVATASEPARASVLGIPTRDRPELLARALGSYAANLREHGRDVQVIVVDDSRQAGSGDANREAAARAQKEFGTEVTVVDRQWRMRYAERLAAETGVPSDVVRFAVLGDERCGLSYGAARNTLQLLSAGRPAIHVDDDTLCRQWRAVYRDRLATRRVVRIAPRATVTDSPVCIGMNPGLDHRRLLPPFMPVQRMEDGIFMTVLRRCMPYVLAGHLANAVDHRPEGRAARETLDFGRAGREYQANDCLRWLILAAGGAQWGDDPGGSMRLLGRFLDEMAALHHREFEAQIRHAGARMIGQQIAALERRLEERGGQPAGWARDAARYIQALQFALTLPDPWLPADLAGSAEERVHTLRSLVGRYGALLGHWTVMLEAAERMPAAGAARPDRSPVLMPGR